MKSSSSLIILTLTALLIAADSVCAQESPGVAGARIGAGTDITGGVAYGAQLDYTLFQNPNAFELGFALFGGTFEEDSDNGFNEYHEETTVVVFAAIANYLFRYSPESEGPYFVAGAGVGAVSVEWEESSATDTSLGTALPGGGSKQSEDGTTSGLILNFGIGTRLNDSFDLRLQVPTFFISAGDQRDSAVVPTVTATLGIKFG